MRRFNLRHVDAATASDTPNKLGSVGPPVGSVRTATIFGKRQSRVALVVGECVGQQDSSRFNGVGVVQFGVNPVGVEYRFPCRWRDASASIADDLPKQTGWEVLLLFSSRNERIEGRIFALD